MVAWMLLTPLLFSLFIHNSIDALSATPCFVSRVPLQFGTSSQFLQSRKVCWSSPGITLKAKTKSGNERTERTTTTNDDWVSSELVVNGDAVSDSNLVVQEAKRGDERVQVTTDVNTSENNDGGTETTATIEIKGDNIAADNLLRAMDELGLTLQPDAAAILAAERAVEELTEDACEVDTETGEPADPEICSDETLFEKAKAKFKNVVGRTLSLVSSSDDAVDVDVNLDELDEELVEGELLEQGWEQRGNRSAFRRNSEVWAFALKCVFRVLKSRRMKLKGASEEELKQTQTEAATYIRDGLVRLGPTFVKLGQVVSTRTDVLPIEYTDVLKTLQDDVPGFSGKRAKVIVTQELGKPCDSVFQNFSEKPLAAASLGQVHTAIFKGEKVAVKVQRAGLKKLFDLDLKNLKKLAELLDKFDPKSDGADRDWVSIYEESERLLYQEIDYLIEANNAERFAKDFEDISWVRVPKIYREVTTPRILTMEFVEAFKLTDFVKIKNLGLDREQLAKKAADSFLRQIIQTGYFHCDPHPGNLCTDEKGNLVFYDFGMMDELKPNVMSGFRKFCTALFKGGPTISDTDLAQNSKLLIEGVEEAGVLSKGADRLAVDKLARYFMRTFKNTQLGKESRNIKETIGPDLQTLTEKNVFKFPSTFTFIFRSFTSIDGIGKGLDPKFDLGEFAQPFVQEFTNAQQYKSKTDKTFQIFKKATGLNFQDINTAVTSPKKVAYIEETVRSMEEGNLKIRVRSLENEKALERLQLTQGRMENILLTSVMLNVAGLMTKPLYARIGLAGVALFASQTILAFVKVKKFDKTQAKFVKNEFTGEITDA